MISKDEFTLMKNILIHITIHYPNNDKNLVIKLSKVFKSKEPYKSLKIKIKNIIRNKDKTGAEPSPQVPSPTSATNPSSGLETLPEDFQTTRDIRGAPRTPTQKTFFVNGSGRTPPTRPSAARTTTQSGGVDPSPRGLQCLLPPDTSVLGPGFLAPRPSPRRGLGTTEGTLGPKNGGE